MKMIDENKEEAQETASFSLAAVTQQLANADNQEQLLRLLIQAGLDATAGEDGGVFLRDRDTQPLELWSETAVKPTETLQNLAKQLLASENTSATQTIDGGIAHLMSLRAQGQALGVLFMVKRSPFSAESLTQLAILSHQAAIGLLALMHQRALQEAQEEKSTFVSHVSHELRLPMTSIKGYTDLMLKGLTGELNEQQTQFMSVIQRNLLRMNALVSGLADLDRFENGRLHLNPEETSLQQLIEKVVDQYRQRIADKEQTISLEFPIPLPLLNLDANRVEQVIQSLLDNAHNYTPAGGNIQITVDTLANEAVQIVMQDSGIGIGEAQLPYIFEPFFRADDTEVRAQHGWGLNLTIAKNLVEAMGGTVGVSSTKGEGSTFRVILPQQ